MRNRTVILLLTYAFLSFECVAFGQNSQGDQEKPVPGAEVFWAKGQRPAKAQYSSSSSTNLRWWGGNIMPKVADIQAIFWGPGWGISAFVGDKIDGLGTFYSGMRFSSYATTADEYYDSSSPVTPDITYSVPVVDLSNASNGSQRSPILSEVC